MQSRLQPVLLGGLFMGVLGALPFVSIGNCCCLWVIGGGMVAAYLLQQGQPAPITSGDGAVVGLMAGVVGAVVHLIVSIPLAFVTGPLQARMMQRVLSEANDMPPEMRHMFETFGGGAAGSMIRLVLGFVFMMVVGVIFGALGGMLGALFFKKDQPPVAPEGPTGPTNFPPPFNPPPLPPE
jgi:hypothetical protein